MSGASDALCRCCRHEARRRLRRRGRFELVNETDWFYALDDDEQAAHIRSLLVVDRAAIRGRRARGLEEAA